MILYKFLLFITSTIALTGWTIEFLPLNSRLLSTKDRYITVYHVNGVKEDDKVIYVFGKNHEDDKVPLVHCKIFTDEPIYNINVYALANKDSNVTSCSKYNLRPRKSSFKNYKLDFVQVQDFERIPTKCNGYAYIVSLSGSCFNPIYSKHSGFVFGFLFLSDKFKKNEHFSMPWKYNFELSSCYFIDGFKTQTNDEYRLKRKMKLICNNPALLIGN